MIFIRKLSLNIKNKNDSAEISTIELIPWKGQMQVCGSTFD